jgi:hypothetical protein
MKKLTIYLALIIIATSYSISQLKTDLDNKDSGYPTILKSQENTILGLFNPENFSMKHSYSMSYSSFGGNGIALGIYTNSMSYKFNDQLNVKTDISLIHSPFSSYSKGVTDQLTGLYLTKAELNYKPYDNFIIQLRYDRIPYNSYDPFYSSYGRRSFYNDPFYDFTR